MGGSSGGGSSKMRVVRYYYTQHLGIAHAGGELLEVELGEKSIWKKDADPNDWKDPGYQDKVWVPDPNYPDNPNAGEWVPNPVPPENIPGRKFIRGKESIFGGIEKEGGAGGTMYIMDGSDSQLLPQKYAEKRGVNPTQFPAYRGQMSVLFTDAYIEGDEPGWKKGFYWAANNPYLKNLWFTYARYWRGWLPQYAQIGDDMNPAHIIVECITNTDWGMGAGFGAIDLPAAEAAAKTLFDEKFGLSMAWMEQAKIEDFINEVLDHIQASLAIDPASGKLRLKLIRADYDVNTLPVLNRDNCDIVSYQRASWGDTVNEINVTWTNPENEEEETVTVHDNANIAMQGGAPNSSTSNYYGVRNRDLALRLGQRDLLTSAAPLLSAEVDAFRQFWYLLPGDVVKLDFPEYGFPDLVMRVGPVNSGAPGGDMPVRLSLVEDVFSMPATAYTEIPDTGWKPDNVPPTPCTYSAVYTLPYYLMTRKLGDNVAAAVEYPNALAGVLAAHASTAVYTMALNSKRVNAAGGLDWTRISTFSPMPRGQLFEALTPAASSFVSIASLTGSAMPSQGDLLMVGPSETTAEFMLVQSYDAAAGRYAVDRGVLDTYPATWPVGTPVWVLKASSLPFDPQMSGYGVTKTVRVQTTTSAGQLPIDQTPDVSGVMTDRHFRPYRPANVRINGDLWPAQVTKPVSITWAHRNRKTETALVLGYAANSVVSETGVTYSINIEAKVDGIWTGADSAEGLTTDRYDIPPAKVPPTATKLRVTLYSVRDGFNAWQRFIHEFDIV